jgi:hypothetical protein
VILFLHLLACAPSADAPKSSDSGHADTGRGDSGGEADSADSAPPDTSDTSATIDTSDTSDTSPPVDPLPTCAEPTPICASGTCRWSPATFLYDLAGDVLVNGVATATTGDLRFRHGDLLLDLDVTGPAWSAVVPAGTWDVTFRMGGTDVAATVADGLVVDRDATLDVGGTWWTLGGSAMWDGGPIPDDPDLREDYRVSLVSGDELWGSTQAVSGYDWSITALPGVYDVVVQAFEEGHGGGLAYGGFVLDSDTRLDIDVPLGHLAGTVRVNGAPVEGEWAEVEAWLDGQVWWTAPIDGSTYALDLPEGTWDLYVSPGEPSQPGAFPAGTVTVAGDTTADLDLTLHHLSGSLTWQGAPILAAYPIDCSSLHFVFDDGAGGSDAYTLDCPTSPNWEVDLPAGTYDVYLDLDDSVADRPGGDVLVAEDLIVDADATVDLDATAYTVSGSARWDGTAPQATYAGGEWGVRFTDVTTGSTLDYEFPTQDTWEALVPVGTYDVDLWLPGDGAYPSFSGWYRVAEDVTVAADTTLDFDVPLYDVSGIVSVDGAPLDGTAGDQIFFHDTGGSGSSIGPDGSYTLRVPAGTWSAYAYGGDLPAILPLGDCIVVGP